MRVVRDGGASLGVCWDSVDFEGLERAAVSQRRTGAVVVHADHALAGRKSLRFEQTLDYEHVGLPPATAVHTMLHRAAARAGRTIAYRVIVSNFDAAFRVVAANLGISVIPRQVGESHAKAGVVRAIPLTDAWAKRRFAVCFRERDVLQPAAVRMLEFLARKADA